MSPQPAVADDATALTQLAWRSLPALKIQVLSDFLTAVEMKPTGLNDRLAIIDQALLMFEHFYPHLTFKQQLYEAANPIEALTSIRHQAASLSETDFHLNVLVMFECVRDAHTLYGLPTPFRDAVAFLPFQMRAYKDGTANRFLVTKVLNGFKHPDFKTGAEIVTWNGVPIETAAVNMVTEQPGGNASAMLARALIAATVRPLRWTRVPAITEDSAVVEYIAPGQAEIRRITLPWGVSPVLGKQNRIPTGTFSVSQQMVNYNNAANWLWRPPPVDAPGDPQDASKIPETFDFRYTGGPRQNALTDPAVLVDGQHPDRKFGYVRILQFSCNQSPLDASENMVAEFRRILIRLNDVARSGLIVDIRGNPGGDIRAAERMLQMMTPHRISPALFHLANTPVVRNLLDGLKNTPAHPGEPVSVVNARAEFRPWIEDTTDLSTSGPLTGGHPLTPIGQANDIGQIYQGPVALLTDALSYSAADIFAGGFQDNGIGTVIGTADNTGGGGAQVWNHGELIGNLPALSLPLHELPGDATMTLAMRRSSRVIRHNGAPLEDAGVSPDVQYRLTKQDLFDSSDLLTFACAGLQPPLYRLDNLTAAVSSGSVTVTAHVENVNEVEFLLDGLHQDVSFSVSGQALSAKIALAPGAPVPSVLRLDGLAAVNGQMTLVVSSRHSLLMPQRARVTSEEPDPLLVSPVS